jgi:hypothetical protein
LKVDKETSGKNRSRTIGTSIKLKNIYKILKLQQKCKWRVTSKPQKKIKDQWKKIKEKYF